MNSGIRVNAFKNVHLEELKRLFLLGDYRNAAYYLAKQRPSKRTVDLVTFFVDESAKFPDSIKIYFGCLLTQASPFSIYESIEFGKNCLQSGNLSGFVDAFNAGVLSCSEDLGDLFYEKQVRLSLAIYNHGNVTDKVIDCLICLKAYENALHFILASGATEQEMFKWVLKVKEKHNCYIEMADFIRNVSEQEFPNLRHDVAAHFNIQGTAELDHQEYLELLDRWSRIG